MCAERSQAKARHDDVELSAKGRRALKQHLASDYHYLDVLRDLSENHRSA